MFKHTSSFVALGILLLVPGARPSLAQVETVRVVVKQAEIRLQANRRSPLIGQAVSGTLLQVLSRERDWYRVIVTPQVRLVPTAPDAGFVEAGSVEVVPLTDPRAIGRPGAATGARQAAGRVAPASPLSIRPRLFGQVAYERFTASRSFEAIFGSAGAPIYGGGIDVLIGRHLFAQVDATHMRRTGERVFVFEGEVFQLGIEEQLQVTPVAVNVGYRFGTGGRLTPYLGAGVAACFYRERSPDVGTGGDTIDRNGIGYQGLGGLEFRLSRWVAAAAEGRYSHIPGILGEDGVSKEFNESNLGGMSAGIKIIVGRL